VKLGVLRGQFWTGSVVDKPRPRRQATARSDQNGPQACVNSAAFRCPTVAPNIPP
jgi:hypothetical protein